MICQWCIFMIKSGNKILLIAKAKGMAQIAKDTSLGRGSLDKAFPADTKPRFDTVTKVMNALHLQLDAKPQLH